MIALHAPVDDSSFSEYCGLGGAELEPENRLNKASSESALGIFDSDLLCFGVGEFVAETESPVGYLLASTNCGRPQSARAFISGQSAGGNQPLLLRDPIPAATCWQAQELAGSLAELP